jgi:hypothetical protein
MRWLFFVAACSLGNKPGHICDAGGYPCGPYGYTTGAVIADVAVSGQRDQNGNGNATDDPVTTIRMSDYRNDSRLKALAIIIGSESCVPCQNEQPSLVALDQRYQGRVAFLEAIVEDAAGQPADQRVINAWVASFNVPFDMTPDPTQALQPYYPANSFPVAMAIRLSDMDIVYHVVGPADGLQQTLDQISMP